MNALSTSVVVVFFGDLSCGIPWALSCSNYSNCVKTRRRPRFDRSHWILIISRRVSLIVTLELGILTSLRRTVTLGQRLEYTVRTFTSPWFAGELTDIHRLEKAIGNGEPSKYFTTTTTKWQIPDAERTEREDLMREGFTLISPLSMKSSSST